MLPGVLGCTDEIVLQRGADTIPHIDVAVTQIFPTLNVLPTLTVIEGVP